MQRRRNYEIIELNWDTDFFGVKSAKLNLNNEINEKEIEDIKNEIQEKEYEFITINNKNNNDKNNFMLQKLNNIFLADINVQFLKRINDTKEFQRNDKIKIENEFNYEKQLLEIAKENFIYSRFYNDKNLRKDKNVYVEWTRNAFGKNDKYFCIYEQENNILGYSLFSIEDNNIIIELIVINGKQQAKRNRNIANKKYRGICYKKQDKRNTCGNTVK